MFFYLWDVNGWIKKACGGITNISKSFSFKTSKLYNVWELNKWHLIRKIYGCRVRLSDMFSLLQSRFIPSISQRCSVLWNNVQVCSIDFIWNLSQIMIRFIPSTSSSCFVLHPIKSHLLLCTIYRWWKIQTQVLIISTLPCSFLLSCLLFSRWDCITWYCIINHGADWEKRMSNKVF